MSKKKLSPDVILKGYWNNNDQFADLFNAILFHGEQVIKADELNAMDTEESNILENKGYAESIKASRDSVKIRKKSTACRSKRKKQCSIAKNIIRKNR